MHFNIEIGKMRKSWDANRQRKLRLHRPWWMFADEELSRIYTDKEVLQTYGKVYYAYLVQANEKLFQRFPPFDYPAQIVYSADEVADTSPLLMQDTIEEIYSYKYSDETPPEEWEAIVENIRDERERKSFSFRCASGDIKIPVKMQVIMVFRKHIPTGVLRSSILPIIACPEKCDSVIVLPEEYWSEDFKTYWLTQ